MEGRLQEERERFGLMWALVLSIAVHLLLVLFTVWVPVSSHSASLIEAPEANEITFRFDHDVPPTTDDPLEDAPFLPVEPRPVAPPQPAPEPAPEPAEPLEPQDAAVPAVEPVEQPVEAEADTSLEEQPSGDDALPVDEAAELDRPPAEDANATGAPPQRQLDVQQALRDFRRSLSHPPRRPSPAASDSPRNVIVPDLSDVPMSGFGMGNLVFESRDYDWSDYGRQIYMAIWRAWHNRLWNSTDEFEKWAHENQSWLLDHQTQVRFVIESNGQVTGIVQEAGSGCLPLDDSALDALAEVILPPLPADFPRRQEVVHARFLARGAVRALRPTLGRLRAMGYF